MSIPGYLDTAPFESVQNLFMERVIKNASPTVLHDRLKGSFRE